MPKYKFQVRIEHNTVPNDKVGKPGTEGDLNRMKDVVAEICHTLDPAPNEVQVYGPTAWITFLVEADTQFRAEQMQTALRKQLDQTAISKHEMKWDIAYQVNS